MHTKNIRYTVRAETANSDVAARFETWMLNEHGRELLSVPGCKEYRLFALSPGQYSCEYLFASEQDLKTYYEKYAANLRHKGSLLFAANEIKFSREESTLIGQESHSGQD